MRARVYSLGAAARPRLTRSVVQGDESTALELLRDRVERVRPLENFCSESLAVLIRMIPELFRARVVVVTARIVGDAPDGHVTDVGHRYARHYQLKEVVIAEPRAQLPWFARRPAECRANPHRYAFDAVFVPIHAGHRFAPD